MCKLYQIQYLCGHTKDIEVSPCNDKLQHLWNLHQQQHHQDQHQDTFRAPTPSPAGFFTNTFTTLSDPLDREYMHTSDELVRLSTQLATDKWGCSHHGVEIMAQKPPPTAGKSTRRGDICDDCRAERSAWWGEGMSMRGLRAYLAENGGFVPGGAKAQRKWAEQKAREEERKASEESLNVEYKRIHGKGIWD